MSLLETLKVLTNNENRFAGLMRTPNTSISIYIYPYIYIYTYIYLYMYIYFLCLYINEKYLLIEFSYGKVPLRAYRDG